MKTIKASKADIDRLRASGAKLGPSARLPKAIGKRNKYRAKAVVIDGIRFASIKEGNRYRTLKALEASCRLVDLVCHPFFRMIVNGIDCGTYTADFRYCLDGEYIVEDVKGGNATRTEAYKLRKRIVEALYGITIQEV